MANVSSPTQTEGPSASAKQRRRGSGGRASMCYYRDGWRGPRGGNCMVHAREAVRNLPKRERLRRCPPRGISLRRRGRTSRSGSVPVAVGRVCCLGPRHHITRPRRVYDEHRGRGAGAHRLSLFFPPLPLTSYSESIPSIKIKRGCKMNLGKQRVYEKFTVHYLVTRVIFKLDYNLGCGR